MTLKSFTQLAGLFKYTWNPSPALVLRKSNKAELDFFFLFFGFAVLGLTLPCTISGLL